MHDYTDHIYGSILIDRIANWAEFCQYRPNRVKSVATCTRERTYVHKSGRRDKHRYWLWHCVACGRTGLVRADTLGLWVKNDHKCKCRRERYGATKTCKYCGRQKPASALFFYKSKTGYLSTNCKECSKILRDGRRDVGYTTGLSDKGVRYDRDLMGCTLIDD